MRTAADVVAFMRAAPTTARLVYPTIGRSFDAYPAFGGIAKGRKMGWVSAGEPYTVAGSFVHEVIPVSDKRVRVRVDDYFPEQAIDFVRVEDAQALTAYHTAFDRYDDAEDAANDELAAVMRRIPDKIDEPRLGYSLTFVRWSQLDLETNERMPAGVIMKTEDGKGLWSYAFPSGQSQAGRWRKQHNVPEDVLKQLPRTAGFYTFISAPEKIRGQTWEDAGIRALYKYGADYFSETGRTLF
jgi:hypothetical protein